MSGNEMTALAEEVVPPVPLSALGGESAVAISPGNQRVLLHRGRTRLRAALEAEMSCNADVHPRD
jgi:hypothetical protein